MNQKVTGTDRSDENGEEVRGNRSLEDAPRQEDGTSMTMAERIALMRSSWVNDILPQPPKKDGWHYCWLSTTNNSDPVQGRVNRGYELVRTSDLPGFISANSGQGVTAGHANFSDLITCREMVLARIPEEVFQDAMKHLHHEAPAEEEERIREGAVLNGENARDSSGRELGAIEGDGFESLVRRTRAPTVQS